MSATIGYELRKNVPVSIGKYVPTINVGHLDTRERLEFLTALEDAGGNEWKLGEHHGESTDKEYIEIPGMTVRELYLLFPQYREYLGIIDPSTFVPKLTTFAEYQKSKAGYIHLQFALFKDTDDWGGYPYFSFSKSWRVSVDLCVGEDYMCPGTWSMETFDIYSAIGNTWEETRFSWPRGIEEFRGLNLQTRSTEDVYIAIVYREIWRLGFLGQAGWEKVKKYVITVMDEE
jgi:hypothetical protein